MTSGSRKWFRSAFGALVAGALGFGTTQALASPAMAPVPFGCQEWQQAECTDWCRSMHPHHLSVTGRCSSSGGSYYSCTCVKGTQVE